MTKSNKVENGFFIGLATLALLSGIYLVVAGDYVMGICGVIVGSFLLWQQFTVAKQDKSKM